MNVYAVHSPVIAPGLFRRRANYARIPANNPDSPQDR